MRKKTGTRRRWASVALLVAASGVVWNVAPNAFAAESARIDAVTGITEGATVTGTARIEARTSGSVDRVEFRLTGPQTVTWTENAAPYFFQGNDGASVPGWDTGSAPGGAYVMTIRAVGPAGNAEKAVSFTVSPAADAGTNPAVIGGVATFHTDRAIGKFTVPDSWSRIVIGAGVTLRGNFVIPEQRTKPLTIAGGDPRTSRLTGDGPHVKDFTRAGVSTEAEIKLTLTGYTSVNPRFYHMSAKKAQVVMSGMTYLDDRDEFHNNSDGFSGGADSLIENTVIDTWDDSVKLYGGDMTISDTTIMHNANGAPIQMGWGDYGRGTLTVDGLTIVANSVRHYNQGVFSWAGGTKADSRTIRIVGDGLIRRTTPGMAPGPLYVFKDGVRNKTINVIGGDCATVRSTAANTVQGQGTSGNKVTVTGCR
jgi:hypothetical protein